MDGAGIDPWRAGEGSSAMFVSVRFDKDAIVETSDGGGFNGVSASGGLRVGDIVASGKKVRVCK